MRFEYTSEHYGVLRACCVDSVLHPRECKGRGRVVQKGDVANIVPYGSNQSNSRGTSQIPCIKPCSNLVDATTINNWHAICNLLNYWAFQGPHPGAEPKWMFPYTCFNLWCLKMSIAHACLAYVRISTCMSMIKFGVHLKRPLTRVNGTVYLYWLQKLGNNADHTHTQDIDKWGGKQYSHGLQGMSRAVVWCIRFQATSHTSSCTCTDIINRILRITRKNLADSHVFGWGYTVWIHDFKVYIFW